MTFLKLPPGNVAFSWIAGDWPGTPGPFALASVQGMGDPQWGQ